MKKIIIILIIIAIVVVILVVVLSEYIVSDESTLEASCKKSGGTVITASCCKMTADFPNNCFGIVGPCGCSPEHSHEIKTCDCGDKCWDGKKCREDNQR